MGDHSLLKLNENIHKFERYQMEKAIPGRYYKCITVSESHYPRQYKCPEPVFTSPDDSNETSVYKDIQHWNSANFSWTEAQQILR